MIDQHHGRRRWLRCTRLGFRLALFDLDIKRTIHDEPGEHLRLTSVPVHRILEIFREGADIHVDSVAPRHDSVPAAMDAHALAVLDFERLRQALRRHAATDLSRAIIDVLAPSASAERLKLSLQQVDEARLLLAQGDPIPVRGLGDVATVIERAREENRGLEPSELLSIACGST